MYLNCSKISLALIVSLSKFSITSLSSPHYKNTSRQLVLVHWTVMGEPLKFRAGKQACHTANFLCRSYSCFYGSRHSWTRPQAGGLTSKEQTTLHWAGEHATKVVHMSSRRGITSAYEGMIGPMKVHKVHERVCCRMRVSSCAVMITQKNNYVITRSAAMFFLWL